MPAPTRSEVIELIEGGENSGVEFKRDKVRPEQLAKEMAALLNMQGGYILLGVEDNGDVSGLTREPKQVEQWVMQAARDNLDPPDVPFWSVVEWQPGIYVGVITLPTDPSGKPYRVKQGGAWITKLRVGTTIRDATRQEEARLHQQAGAFWYGLKPIAGAVLEYLDDLRLEDYFRRVLRMRQIPERGSDGWSTLLYNHGFAAGGPEHFIPTVSGMLLFGSAPSRHLPQAIIRAICYDSDEQDYATLADETLDGPMVPLIDSSERITELGLADKAWEFVRLNIRPSARLDAMRRIDLREYPEEAVRECVTNALIHRDYGIAGTGIMIVIYNNRIEVRSPGRLPNTMTPEKMQSGARYARNQTLMNVMRDYGYVDDRGMGVKDKIIPAMWENNRTVPQFISDDDSVTVRLWKDPSDRMYQQNLRLFD